MILISSKYKVINCNEDESLSRREDESNPKNALKEFDNQKPPTTTDPLKPSNSDQPNLLYQF